MKLFSALLTLLFIIYFLVPSAPAEITCVHAGGESVIINQDVPSARLESIARAKWDAVEQVAGTQVKAQSFVQNFRLVEDAVITKSAGVVQSYKMIGEQARDNLYTVKIHACVEQAYARDAVSELGMNNSVSLFIPARKPGRSDNAFEEANVLSEILIAKLIEQGYRVTDAAPKKVLEARDIESAMRSGNFMTLRSLMYKFLSNLIIIGKVDYTLSTRKGEKIGYGLTMPFNHVTVRLNYRIVSQNKAGNMEILAAGVREARGLAHSVEDAANKAMKDLAENLAPILSDQVGQYIKVHTKKVSIQIQGVKDPEAVFRIKSQLQNIAWVSDVEEKQMGSFVVSYAENTLYLANSILQKGLFKLVSFSPHSLCFKYEDS